MRKIASQLVVAIVCALLGFFLTYQFKMLNLAKEGQTTTQNQDILAEIERLKKEKEELLTTNNSLSEELKKLEDEAASEGDVEGEIKKALDNTRMQLGLLDVKGPGVVITLAPKSNIFGSNSTETSWQMSEDELVYIVNILWYARAEAISINDMRITPQTGIKTSGKSISISSIGKVDPNEKIVIKAIGDKSRLNVAVNYGGSLSYGALKNYTTDVKQTDEVVVNKTTQSFKNEFMKPVQ